jgi:hypothetical protein
VTDRHDDGRLPDFVVVGAMKSGTTSLARWLKAHPDVFIAPNKELHFFERDPLWENGVDWYRRQFTGAGGARVVGEASPSYMYAEKAVPRMASVVPSARLVACLREPVDRAYSHYWHNRRSGRERREFAAAVDHELRQPRERQRGYLARGRYVEQLERLVAHYPRESLLVLLTDDLSSDAVAAYQATCRHIGVDDSDVPEAVGQVENSYRARRGERLYKAMYRYRLWRWVPTSLRPAVGRAFTRPAEYEPLDDALRARLRESFADDNAALARWLGRDLSAWT